MNVSTHVLDTSTGRPIVGLTVWLERFEENNWLGVAAALTDEDGRILRQIDEGVSLPPGRYRLNFDTGAYFQARVQPTLFPQVQIIFDIVDAGGHYHLPLLMSPFGYTIYRGT